MMLLWRKEYQSIFFEINADFMVIKALRNMSEGRHDAHFCDIARPDDQLVKVIVSGMDILPIIKNIFE